MFAKKTVPVHALVRQDEEAPGDPDDDDLDASSGSDTESVRWIYLLAAKE